MLRKRMEKRKLKKKKRHLRGVPPERIKVVIFRKKKN